MNLIRELLAAIINSRLLFSKFILFGLFLFFSAVSLSAEKLDIWDMLGQSDSIIRKQFSCSSALISGNSEKNFVCVGQQEKILVTSISQSIVKIKKKKYYFGKELDTPLVKASIPKYCEIKRIDSVSANIECNKDRLGAITIDKDRYEIEYISCY